jgi:phage terminase large subunit
VKQPPPPPDRALLRRLGAALKRSRGALVPLAFQWLWEKGRYKVAYGSRGSAKSTSVARVLLVQAYEKPLRILCCREIQSSMKESSLRLLANQAEQLGLGEFFHVGADSIRGKNGSEFLFEGLQGNAPRIRSIEDIDAAWCEEAQSICEASWETLLPCIRKRGSQIFITFNPTLPTDPVWVRFVAHTPPGCVARKSTWADNPYLSPEMHAEREWLEQTDADAARHVWAGEFRVVSDALVLKGRYHVESFTVSPAWAGPFHGLDFGFSSDPSAAVRLYIDDSTTPQTLYVANEYWQLGCEIDALRGALEAAIPGISRYVTYADSARPETISFLQKNGMPSVEGAAKWKGSVADGVAYLRKFRIVVAPECKHFIDECQTYQFRCDRLTGQPLPELIDKCNHLLDAARYALGPLIAAQPAQGYFSRAAMLVNGEPLEVPTSKLGRARKVFLTAAFCEHTGAVGLVYWAGFPHLGVPFVALDYELAEVAEALDGAWLAKVFARAQELRAQWDAVELRTCLHVEQGELHQALTRVFCESVVKPFLVLPPYDLVVIESRKLPPSVDERANAVRADVNAGRYVKFAASAYARQVTHRTTTANHLPNQVLGFRPGAQDTATELVVAFLLAFSFPWQPAAAEGPQTEDTATETPARALVAAMTSPADAALTPTAAPPAGAGATAVPAHAPAPPPWRPTIWLTPGRHVINGQAVDIAPDGDRDLIQHHLPPGRHVVDNKVCIVPGRGVRM